MSPQTSSDFGPFEAQMRAADLPQVAIETFRHYYHQLAAGETGLIPEQSIEPVESLPDAETLPEELRAVGNQALASTVLLKLNGGLGTSMGLAQAKSLLVVKQGLSFLEIIARQAQASGIPLVLMNSFSTRDDSLALLDRLGGATQRVPRDFMQHKVPKVCRADLSPARSAATPELSWCPPGHGDIYTALVTTGMLDALLAAGYQRAFVSNADNLGAVIDALLLGYFVAQGLPFMMECADRTSADRKGGHLARLPGGQLVLRESAQCPAEDQTSFQDVSRHKYFNTNNLWIDLRALKALMQAKDNILGLALIRNAKTLDPRDPASTPVFQLETAMGSAIAVFEGAGAVRVPRLRFAPVKTTSDLLAVRSDDYVLSDSFTVTPNPARVGAATDVRLDPETFKLIDQLEARFPHGPPSLVGCEALTVLGDVVFGAGVVVTGSVHLEHRGPEPHRIPDGAHLHGEA